MCIHIFGVAKNNALNIVVFVLFLRGGKKTRGGILLSGFSNHCLCKEGDVGFGFNMSPTNTDEYGTQCLLCISGAHVFHVQGGTCTRGYYRMVVVTFCHPHKPQLCSLE